MLDSKCLLYVRSPFWHVSNLDDRDSCQRSSFYSEVNSLNTLMMNSFLIPLFPASTMLQGTSSFF